MPCPQDHSAVKSGRAMRPGVRPAAALLLALLACGGESVPTEAPGLPTGDNAVYRAILDAGWNAGPPSSPEAPPAGEGSRSHVVVPRQTVPVRGARSRFQADDPGWLARLTEGWAQLRDDTYADFLAVADDVADIGADFGPDARVVMPPDGEPFDYEQWRASDPDAACLLEFSRVGYSRDGSQALVYCGFMVHRWFGGGSLYFLERRGETWRVVGSRRIWAS